MKNETTSQELLNQPKIAIVHDWLVTFGGAENVLLQLLDCFPQADLYCIVERLPEQIRIKFPDRIQSTFIQKLPFATKLYWYYSPLMPLAIEQLDLSAYDLVLSSSHCFAKGVIVHPHQLHISYIHSPARFAWDLQFDYFRNFSFEKGLKRILASLMFFSIRNWDARSSNGVDLMIANSRFIQKRILKCYRRSSELLYPGIDTDRFVPIDAPKETYYLAGSFMNPFKKLDLIVETFTKLPHKTLFLFGSGPQEKYLKKIAGPNIHFLGRVSDDKLVTLLQQAKAFIFAATEDFGMIMAEAQACGTPVIAYQKGGASEIVICAKRNKTNPTGILFERLSTENLSEAIQDFEKNTTVISTESCRTNALRFNSKHFKDSYKKMVAKEWENWQKALNS